MTSQNEVQASSQDSPQRRLPTASDFPSNLQITIVPPPPAPSTPAASQPSPTNVLILLHGLGDTNIPFASLGRQLSLAETVCLSVQAPTPLPFELGGFHWGDDIQFDQASGNMDFDTGFGRATKILTGEVIQKGLLDKCGFQRRDVVLFGFGQGGMAALAAATASSASGDGELGGVVSIGGPMPSSFPRSKVECGTGRMKTPVLVLGGATKSLITASAITRLKEMFEFFEYRKWQKAGDGMPGNREEMLPIMQFFARRLRSRRGVPEGSIEIT
ncbi:MAG: hypothetical protein M1837_006446 [Sclerophora amabilis]|nr:MAG: hypothetical protein M1837_006446 [Sclerophora amabilis]